MNFFAGNTLHVNSSLYPHQSRLDIVPYTHTSFTQLSLHKMTHRIRPHTWLRLQFNNLTYFRGGGGIWAPLEKWKSTKKFYLDQKKPQSYPPFQIILKKDLTWFSKICSKGGDFMCIIVFIFLFTFTFWLMQGFFWVFLLIHKNFNKFLTYIIDIFKTMREVK